MAKCLDLEASGEGRTPDEALASLRAALEEREMPEAVAPPEDTHSPRLEIVVVADQVVERKADEPTGPGDPG